MGRESLLIHSILQKNTQENCGGKQSLLRDVTDAVGI